MLDCRGPDIEEASCAHRVSPMLIHVPIAEFELLAMIPGIGFLRRCNLNRACQTYDREPPAQRCYGYPSFPQSSSRDTPLNNHRIHTALHGLRHHTLTGALDLVCRKLPLKIDRPPYQPRSNEKSKHCSNHPLDDEPNSSRAASRAIRHKSGWLNFLLVRYCANRHR